jgi:hypothetical protein
MRLPVVLALCALPPAVAGGGAACGGPTFTSAAVDASTTSPTGSSDGAPATGRSFCALEAGANTFCDDFDGPPLASKWDSIDQAGTGAIAVIDTTASYSPPGSFKSVAPFGVGVQKGRLVKAFGTASRVVVAFEVLLDTTPMRLPGGVGGDSLIGINVGASYSIGIAAHTDQVSYFEDATVDGGTVVLSSKDLVATPTLHGWTAVAVTIDLAHANLSVSIGGVQLLVGAPITPPGEQAISVDLGTFVHNETQTLAAHYDNFTIDLTP